MHFTIFTHVQHNKLSKTYSAYAPYVREMNLWLRGVEEVEIVAPGHQPTIVNARLAPKEEGNVQEIYEHSHLTFTRIPSFHLLNFTSSLKAVLGIPVIIFRIVGAMKRADHLHLRCPGNIGLLACICQIFFPAKSKSAKYAGNWDPGSVQPWTYKLQKWILSNTLLTRNMQVLVYGDWPGQTRNIKPFFTASFSEQEISAVNEKNFDRRLIFLFVGNLVPGKHPLKVIQLIQEIKNHKYQIKKVPQISLEIYGDGPERKMLEAYCRNEKLEGLVQFKGSRPLDDLKEAYQNAHFVILPSRSEGWPKAIAEGMFFGCIPIATPVSCVPWMLDYGERGVLLEETGQSLIANNQQPDKTGQRTDGGGQRFDTSNPIPDAQKVLELLQDPEEMQRKSLAAKAWSQQYTLERFEEAIKDVLAQPAR